MSLRNMTMYSVFVRNHGGTFRKAAEDMPRIRELGADIVWLMPIHPIGKTQRKGTLGSPYAISDYRAVNPEYGTKDDLRYLADVVHQNGMKLIIDVVYNHTSPDSVLSREHPEWFYHKPDGSFGNRIGEWSDIIDLDYNQPGLWDYQIDTLKMWAEIVDGFRCDVAPLLPLKFWLRAREEVETVRPGCIWLSESVEPSFIRDNRNRGMISLSDSEIYQAFDISYDYDIYGDFIDYVEGKTTLADYAAALLRQEGCYPVDYVKLRFLENHDRPRMAFLFPDENVRMNWFSWMFFQKGIALLYSGQEWQPVHRPDLFDLDPVPMNGKAPLTELIIKLSHMKKDELFANGAYDIIPRPNDVLTAAWKLNSRRALGIFSLKGKASVLPAGLSDGKYVNFIDGCEIWVESGLIATDGKPIIIFTDDAE